MSFQFAIGLVKHGLESERLVVYVVEQACLRVHRSYYPIPDWNPCCALKGGDRFSNKSENGQNLCNSL